MLEGRTMDYKIIGIVFTILSILMLVATLILVVVSLMTAISCSRSKLAPTAAWLLVIAFGVSFFIDIAFMINNHALGKAFGYGVTQWISVFLSFIYLLTGLLLVAAFALFRASKPAETLEGKEAAHG